MMWNWCRNQVAACPCGLNLIGLWRFGHAGRNIKDRPKQRHRIVRTEMRRLRGLSIRIRIDDHRAVSGTQDHLPNGSFHAPRRGYSLPGEQDKQRQYKRQRLMQNSFHFAFDIGRTLRGLQAQSNTLEARGSGGKYQPSRSVRLTDPLVRLVCNLFT